MTTMSMPCVHGMGVASATQVDSSSAWRMRRRYRGFSFSREVAVWLEARLRGLKNRDACGQLALYLAERHRHSDRTFPVDRRALAAQCQWILHLSADVIRGAKEALEAIGFLERRAGGRFNTKSGRNTVVEYSLCEQAAAIARDCSPTVGLQPTEEDTRARSASACRARFLPGPAPKVGHSSGVEAAPSAEAIRRIDELVRSFKLGLPLAPPSPASPGVGDV